MYMEYVPCIGNSSYSFWWILLKLYRCFKDGLEICILFFQNPEIIFYHFFRIFNLDIFRALILQICIWSIYLVSATPPTVFGESFWNFTVVFRMVWRYAYCFLRILKLFFLHFNLDIISSLYATDMYREYMPCIGNPAYSFRPILLKLYRYFAAFLWFHMRNLSLAGYNCSGGASCMACSFIYSLLFKSGFCLCWDTGSACVGKSTCTRALSGLIWYFKDVFSMSMRKCHAIFWAAWLQLLLSHFVWPFSSW